jgi:prepilin-type N-terminal cleavage/methylation domain-containing protein
MRAAAVAPRRQRGLSLLEVLVALVILTGFGAALFTWAGQTLQSANRAIAMQRETELANNITELATSLNPALQPDGELETATHRYRWTAVPLRGPVDQVRHPAGDSPFQVALFKVSFTVTDLADGRAAAVGERTVAGHRLVRPVPSSGLFGGAPALTPP